MEVRVFFRADWLIKYVVSTNKSINLR